MTCLGGRAETLSLTPSLPPGSHKFIFYICDSIAILYISLFLPHPLFQTPHISDAIWCLSVSDTSLSITICKSLHVVADGIISFIFIAE